MYQSDWILRQIEMIGLAFKRMLSAFAPVLTCAAFSIAAFAMPTLATGDGVVEVAE